MIIIFVRKSQFIFAFLLTFLNVSIESAMCQYFFPKYFQIQHYCNLLLTYQYWSKHKYDKLQIALKSKVCLPKLNLEPFKSFNFQVQKYYYNYLLDIMILQNKSCFVQHFHSSLEKDHIKKTLYYFMIEYYITLQYIQFPW